MRCTGAGGESWVCEGFAPDGDVVGGSVFLKPDGENAVVLKTLRSREQTGGDAPLAVAEDGFKDLHPIDLCDEGEMRRIPCGICIVCIPGNHITKPLRSWFKIPSTTSLSGQHLSALFSSCRFGTTRSFLSFSQNLGLHRLKRYLDHIDGTRTLRSVDLNHAHAT